MERCHCRSGLTNDKVGLELHELGGLALNAVAVAATPAKLDLQVVPLHPAHLFKGLE